MTKFTFLCFLTAATLGANAQQKIKDGTGTPVTSLPAAGSILELQSTQAGLRFPQVSLTDTKTWAPLLGSGAAATSPGMTVYNTNAAITNTTADANYPALGKGEYYWDGTGWVVKNPVATAAYVEPWYNTATNAGATGNTQNIYQTGNVGIGTSAPNSNLHVDGIVRVMPGGPFTGNIILGTASSDGIELNTASATAFMGVQRSNTGSNFYLTKDIGTGTQLNYEIFNRSGTTIGSITSPAGASIAYNTTSDIRLKENISTTHYGIRDLMKISVAEYNYKSDISKSITTGFLAQDLYNIYPDAVTPGGANEKTEPWQIDYSKLTPLLVKSVQDQQKEIEELKAEIAELKALIKK
jgi:hypothetical protein